MKPLRRLLCSPVLLIRLAIQLVIPLALSACLVVPIFPHEHTESRKYVGENAPESFKPGTTTRADILLALGEPDIQSENHLRFTYTRKTSLGGMLLLIAGSGSGAAFGGESVAYSHLTVRFDDAGKLEDSRFERTVCYQPAMLQDRACAPEADTDFLRQEELAAQRRDQKMSIQYLGNAYWLPGVPGYKDLANFHGKEPMRLGKLVISNAGLLFFSFNADRQSRPLLKLSYDEIKDVELHEFLVFRRLAVVRADGRYESFDSTKKDGSTDMKETENAGKLLKSLWQAATRR